MKTLSPAVITLPRRQDAAEFYFSRLSHLPWAMLLHSGYADHPYSRFDIVVADPICTLTTFGKETVVSESEKRTTTTDDPLQVLQQVLDRADIRPTHNEDLPFQGGALGLFGYDLGRRFESLPEIAEQDIVLPDMAVGIYDWALIVDHQRHTVSLLSHNDVNARRAAGKPAILAAGRFHAHFRLAIQYDPRAVMAKNFAVYRNICTAVIAIR